MKIKDLNFKASNRLESDCLYASNTELGRITVLSRMTGFGHRDIETGYTDNEDKFWLASGQFDIRNHPDISIEDAIALIKKNANTCVAANPLGNNESRTPRA